MMIMKMKMKMKKRKPGFTKSKFLVKLACIIISTLFIVVQIISALRLGRDPSRQPKLSKTEPSSNGSKIAKLGELVIGMLPKDLAFTIFLPSEEAFRRDMRLSQNDSNSYAILTRVLGFSAVPRWILPADLEHGKEKIYESISGLNLYVSKDSKGMVRVNGIASEEIGLKIHNLVVYVMNGVVMDFESEQSMEFNDDEERRGKGEKLITHVYVVVQILKRKI